MIIIEIINCCRNLELFFEKNVSLIFFFLQNKNRTFFYLLIIQVLRYLQVRERKIL